MTTTIVFDHRGRTPKGRPGALEIRISIKSKLYYINSGVKVLKSEWKYDHVVNRPDSDELNERLAILSRAIAEEVNDRLERNEAIDVTSIKNAVWGQRSPYYDDVAGRHVGNAPFLTWYEERMSVLGLRAGTLKHYKTTLTHIRACGYLIRWKDVTVENIRRFDAYLHGLRIQNSVVRAGGEQVALTQGTIYNQHKNLKAMLRRAVGEGLLDRNPYDKMHGEIKRGDKETVEYLTIDELKRLEQLDLSGRGVLEISRDLFVFQAYTGMGFSDMQSFKMSDCRSDGQRWTLSKQRVKTGVTYYVQLLPPALAVVRKYGGVIPHICEPVYNRTLKALALMVGINKRVTSHVARHTFATWMLHNEVPIERVAKMLGHSNIIQTQRYAKVIARDVFGEFDRIEDQMKSK